MSESRDGLPPPEELLTVRTDRVGPAIVVTAVGEVDVLTAPRLRLAVDRALAQAHSDSEVAPVVIDLAEVTFLGSRGLSALLDAHREADAVTPLRVVVDTARPVIRPLQLSGIDQVLELFHTVDDALAGEPEADVSG